MPSGPSQGQRRLCVRRGASVSPGFSALPRDGWAVGWPSPPARRTLPAQAPGPRIQNNRQAEGRRGDRRGWGLGGPGNRAARGRCAGRGSCDQTEAPGGVGARGGWRGVRRTQPGGSSRRPGSLAPSPTVAPGGGAAYSPPATGLVRGTGVGGSEGRTKGHNPFRK